MEPISKNYTNIDYFIVNDLTKSIPKTDNKYNRLIFQCNIDKTHLCEFIITNQGVSEYQRLFKHFLRAHSNLLSNILLKYLIDHPTIQEKMSSIPIVEEYIKNNIFPIYLAEKQKSQSIDINITNQNGSEHLLDISKIDITKLNQTVLAQGIYEHTPLSVISSKAHSSFIKGFMYFGFEFGRNTNISPNQFSSICDKVDVSRTLLDKIGGDYFEFGISVFKGSLASFQIDATKHNGKEILVFILSAKNRYHKPFLFDIQQEFQGDLEAYRQTVKDKILKAKQYQITIVGLTSDNLPVQLQAISHESRHSIQNKYLDMQSIVHFRCSSHLLDLAYKYWLKSNNFLAKYDKKIRNIMSVLNSKIFVKKISRKIPAICITRWNSSFRALETIFHLRKDIISLFQKPTKKELKMLLKVKEDIKYIFSYGFLKVYPLLFHFATLVEYIQNENLSCVESTIIIEYFLAKIKNNIKKYEIDNCGYDLYKLIKKKLILNKNVQLYQLASLMHPEGIVRYRKIMSSINQEYNIIEDNDSFFHCIKDDLQIEIMEKNRFISVEDYKKNEYKKYIEILTQLHPMVNRKTKSNDPTKKQLDLHSYFSPKTPFIDENSLDDSDTLPMTIDLRGNAEQQNNDGDLQVEIVENFNQENILYTINIKEKAAYVVNNKNAKGDIFIPKSIKYKSVDFNVLGIKQGSFMNSKSIKSIRFPKDSKIKTIEKNAFAYSSLEKLVIPSSVVNLNAGWCRGTSKLVNITIMSKNECFIYYNDTMIIGKSDIKSNEYDKLLFMKRDATEISIPSFIKYIDSYAFSESSIESIYIPPQIVSICKGAFYNCKYLVDVTIPKGSKLNRIEKFAFAGSMIPYLRIPSKISHLGELWCDDLTKVKKVRNITNYENEVEDIFEYDYSDDEKEYDNNEEEESSLEEEEKNDQEEEKNDQEEEKNDENIILPGEIFAEFAEENIENKEKENKTQNKGNIDEIRQNNDNIESSENQKDDKINEDLNCYSKRKYALQWNNITDLIHKNAKYLGLNSDEASKFCDVLHDFVTMPFSIIQLLCQNALSKNAKFTKFWSQMRGFEYEQGQTFSIVADVALRLYVISATEVDAERAFSKIKYRFDDRRTSIKQSTMFNELQIENVMKNKIESGADFTTTMFQHPEHKS